MTGKLIFYRDAPGRDVFAEVAAGKEPMSIEPRPVCEAEGCDGGEIEVFDCDCRHFSEHGGSCSRHRETCSRCDGTGFQERREDIDLRQVIETEMGLIARGVIVRVLREAATFEAGLMEENAYLRRQIAGLQKIVREWARVASEADRCEQIGKTASAATETVHGALP